MRQIWSPAGFLALCAFGVWFTIIFARTNAFTALQNDPQRTFAILGSAVAMATFGVAIHRIFIDRE